MDTPRPQLLDFQFHQNNDSFTLHFQQRLILTHSKDNPCLWIGSGIAGNDSNLLIVFYVQRAFTDKQQIKRKAQSFD